MNFIKNAEGAFKYIGSIREKYLTRIGKRKKEKKS
jgi:hypothetical protein